MFIWLWHVRYSARMWDVILKISYPERCQSRAKLMEREMDSQCWVDQANFTCSSAPGKCLQRETLLLLSIFHWKVYSFSLLLLKAARLQYKQCHCYLSWPLKYFIQGLGFCWLLAAIGYKNSPLVIKGIKMQSGSWTLRAALLTFAGLALKYWQRQNKAWVKGKGAQREHLDDKGWYIHFIHWKGRKDTNFMIRLSFIPCLYKKNNTQL